MLEYFTLQQTGYVLEQGTPRMRSWIKNEYIPHIPKFEGQGVTLILDRQDIYRIGIYSHLVANLRMHRELAKNILKQIFPLDFKKVNQILIVNRPKGSMAISHPTLDGVVQAIIENHGDWSSVIAVDFAKIRDHIDQRIEKIKD